jgi:hypothetical protein
MEKEERDTKPRFGLANSKKRRHSRFSIDLPIEYWQINNSKSRYGRTIDVSEDELGQKALEFGLRNEL